MEAAVAIRSVRVSVVIPAMNEAENLPHVFPRLPDGLHEVILPVAEPSRERDVRASPALGEARAL